MNKWVRLYIQIFVVFIVMFLVSFIPELYPEVFGDWKCGGYFRDYMNDKFINTDCLYYQENHGPKWHWGWRHWLMSSLSFIYLIIAFAKMNTDWEKSTKEEKQREKAPLKWYDKPADDVPIRVSHTDPEPRRYVTGPMGE
jgi:hypothetical protein